MASETTVADVKQALADAEQVIRGVLLKQMKSAAHEPAEQIATQLAAALLVARAIDRLTNVLHDKPMFADPADPLDI